MAVNWFNIYSLEAPNSVYKLRVWLDFNLSLWNETSETKCFFTRIINVYNVAVSHNGNYQHSFKQ